MYRVDDRTNLSFGLINVPPDLIEFSCCDPLVLRFRHEVPVEDVPENDIMSKAKRIMVLSSVPRSMGLARSERPYWFVLGAVSHLLCI